MRGGRTSGAGGALLDRLKLDEKRVEAMARALEDIAELPDPIGTVLAEWTRPNGMRIQRRRVPLGVIGIIYESRPNVTADAGALCLKSGNAVILRGGSESARSNAAIHACLVEGLHAADLPRDCHPAGADHRSRRGRLHARRDGAIHRRDRAARRQEPDRARAAGGARAGHRPSRGRLPRVRRARREPRHGTRHRAQRQDAPHRRLRRGRDAAGGPRLRATHLAPLVAALLAAGCEVRGDETALRADRAGQAGHRAGLVHRISRCHHCGARGRRGGRGDRAHPPLRLAAHRLHRHRRCRRRRSAS